MRFAVLIFGILGAGCAGVLALRWYQDAQLVEPQMRAVAALGQFNAEVTSKLREFERAVQATYFLFAAVVLGLAGGVLGFLGKGGAGAVLMFLAAVGPGILHLQTFVFTCPLLIGAVLSLFVRPPSRWRQASNLPVEPVGRSSP